LIPCGRRERLSPEKYAPEEIVQAVQQVHAAGAHVVADARK